MSVTARTITKKILCNKEAYKITDNITIENIFNKIIKQGKFFSVILDNTRSEYVSYILDVDFNNDTIIFDALHPNNGNYAFVRAKRAYLLSALDGVDILIPVKPKNSTSINSQGKDEIYCTSLPEKIYLYQRRGNYRVNTHESDQIVFGLPEVQNIIPTTKTNNISAGGVSINVMKGSSITINDELKKCKLYINNQKVLYVDTKVTYINSTAYEHELIVGLKFIHLDNSIANIIDKLVRKSERHMLRELSRSDNKSDVTVYA